ncbi:enoyl-CoA hydratase/carnithine racemase [Sphingomonas jinjuensis]|uniref:Enoyl-CoA hydratase/carnithine racemase n=1 Tax=Sphingomonas jinjuensis TaxID=535907 RepID=A0A840F742_9SPHN|nr:enoyl-CoA hydratase/isomerase family protein [Sphingomonas jinjuensis]MBB4155083.1 enoyl-CoA hydratase/carnithine racemase [Sphingomonas jinjuensis]
MTDFDAYRNKFEMIRLSRDEDGILLMQLHTDGGPLRWSLAPHKELEQAFLDISRDRENQVVIVTGTGEEFSGPAVYGAADRSVAMQVPADDWYWMGVEGKRYVMNMLNIEVPMISAVNGPALRHAIIPVMCDLVLAAHTAAFQDSAHFAGGLVPGDGHGVIFPFLMGTNRGRYFLMTGQRLSAAEAREAGLVNEVLAGDRLMPRAYELAHQLLRTPPLVRRYTRVLLTQRLRAALHDSLGYGFAMEGHAIA